MSKENGIAVIHLYKISPTLKPENLPPILELPPLELIDERETGDDEEDSWSAQPREYTT